MKNILKRRYPHSSGENNSANNTEVGSNRINYKGKVIAEYNSDSREGAMIISVFQKMLTENWFTDLNEESTAPGYILAITCFSKWLNSQNNVGADVINKYQRYEISSLRRRPRTCYAHHIKTIIKRVSMRSESVETFNFLRRLEKSSNLDRGDGLTDSIHISEWIANHQWIRKSLGKQYILLESPKRVNIAFTTTISEALIFILESRQTINNNEIIKKLYIESATNKLTSSRAIARLYAQLLDSAKSELGGLQNQLFNMILVECVKGNRTEAIVAKAEMDERYSFSSELFGLSSGYPFIRPGLFVNEISETEELLMYWLLVSLAVQPSDAAIATRHNLAIKRNEKGRIRTLEFKYLKGRSNRFHESPILKSGNIMLTAISMYIDALPKDQHELFKSKKINRNRTFSNPFYTGRTTENGSALVYFLKLTANKEFTRALDTKYGSETNIFHKAILALACKEAMDFSCYSSPKNLSIPPYEDYTEQTDYPLAQSFLTPSHIKNTAVYAKSDRYRDGDLINLNSHTSQTEKLSYMTDDNKEWVNQSGRISRMVMTGLEREVYRPILDRLERKIREKVALTEIVSSLEESNETKPKNMNWDENFDNQIVVVESVSTAIKMLFFIEQAYKYQSSLRERNDTFFFETVLVKSEWMHYCIGKFHPETVIQASIKLDELRSVLPDLFINQLNAGETA